MMKRLYPVLFTLVVAASTIFAVRAQDTVQSHATIDITATQNSEQSKLAQEDNRLRNATGSLVHKYRKASAEQKVALEKQLRDVVSQHFKVRQQMRDQEITKLTERLNELKDLQQRRQTQSEKIVDDQLQHLIREASGLGWGANPSPQGFQFNYVPNDFNDVQQFSVHADHPASAAPANPADVISEDAAPIRP